MNHHITPPLYSAQASLVKRMVAVILDYALVSVVTVTFYRFVDFPEIGSYHSQGGYIYFAVFLWLLYFPLMEFIFGMTLGKWLFDIKVINKDGSDTLLNQTLKRHLLDIVDFSFFGLTAILIIKFTHQPQRLGDMWAGTLVIKQKKKKKLKKGKYKKKKTKKKKKFFY
jgi:uncharacterized RDD family membrane protein YckC